MTFSPVFSTLSIYLATKCHGILVTSFAHVASSVAVKRQIHANIFRSIFRSSSSSLHSGRSFIELEDNDGVVRALSYAQYGVESGYPPILLIPGTAQTIDTFSQHISALARERRLFIVEMRGQGRTELLSKYATMDQHVTDLVKVMKTLNLSTVDVVGFSFGARVGLALASHEGQYVRKLSVTGVPLIRSELGKAILQSWLDGLREGHMSSVGWSFVLNGFSESFLNREDSVKRLRVYIKAIIDSNNAAKVADLIELSNIPEYLSASSCSSKIKGTVQVIGFKGDRIADCDSVRDLARNIPNAELVVLDGGHLSPFENPKSWRDAVLAFLN